MEDYGLMAKNYQERAEELRAIADNSSDSSCRNILVNCAEDYERMAHAIGKIITSQAYIRSSRKLVGR